MKENEYLNKKLINQIIGNCLHEIQEKTGVVLDAKVNGRVISLFLDDPDNLNITDLDCIERVVVETLGYENTNILKGKNRKREYVDARAIFSYISRKYNFSLAGIGDHIKKDHTTIIHHIRKAGDLLETDPLFLNKYNKVIEKLKDTYGKVIY